jgi:hypothetical protein
MVLPFPGCLKSEILWYSAFEVWTSLRFIQRLGKMAYNPSYSGGKDRDDICSGPAWGKKLVRPACPTPAISTIKLGMLICACHPCYGGRSRRWQSSLAWAENVRPYPKEKRKAKRH